MLAYRFQFYSDDVKATLFRCYCYQWHFCSLWSMYGQNTMNRSKLTYNKVIRRMMGIPPWCSANAMFLRFRVGSFQEVMRVVIYGLLELVKNSENMKNVNLNGVWSQIRAAWRERLAIR